MPAPLSSWQRCNCSSVLPQQGPLVPLQSWHSYSPLVMHFLLHGISLMSITCPPFPSSVIKAENKNGISVLAKECHGIWLWGKAIAQFLVLFHALFLLPARAAVVGCGGNWNLTVLILSVPLFATMYSPISVCALKHIFSDVARPLATAACVKRTAQAAVPWRQESGQESSAHTSLPTLPGGKWSV